MILLTAVSAYTEKNERGKCPPTSPKADKRAGVKLTRSVSKLTMTTMTFQVISLHIPRLDMENLISNASLVACQWISTLIYLQIRLLVVICIEKERVGCQLK